MSNLIESNRSLVEMGKMDFSKKSFITVMLNLVVGCLNAISVEKERTTEVGRWWNTRSEDEIDMIAIERLDKRVTVAEVKRNANKINIAATKERLANIRSHFRGYEIIFIPLSLEDM